MTEKCLHWLILCVASELKTFKLKKFGFYNMPHISRGTQGAVPYQLLIGTGTIRPNNSRKRFYLRSIVLDAGGKPENPEKNLQKQIWTGNQMHVQRQDRKSNLDSMVHSARTANRTWTQWCTAGGGG